MNTTTRSKAGKTALRIIAALVALVLLLFTFSQISLAIAPTVRLASGELSFKEYTQELQSTLAEEAFGKYAFINLNGLYCRAIGRNICNQIMRLNNGMLTNFAPERNDMTAPAQAIAQLNDFCASQGIRLIFALTPEKLDAESALLIPGEENHCNENGDELLARLSDFGVDTIDLRDYLAQTPAQVEQHFFRTDHHWNFTGAFTAYQVLMAAIDERFPDAGIDLTLTDSANWDAHTLEDWMLGSQGKRTGVYFGGLDDITYYTPRFETQISCDIVKASGESAHFEGDFSAANLRNEYLGARPDLFDSSPYDMYIGGEYPFVSHRSADAPSDLRLVMIKDSFSLPVQAFMSTQFQYIDAIDPRYTGENVAAHLVDAQPDVVLILLSESAAGSYEAYSDYGVTTLLSN